MLETWEARQFVRVFSGGRTAPILLRAQRYLPGSEKPIWDDFLVKSLSLNKMLY